MEKSLYLRAPNSSSPRLLPRMAYMASKESVAIPFDGDCTRTRRCRNRYARLGHGQQCGSLGSTRVELRAFHDEFVCHFGFVLDIFSTCLCIFGQFANDLGNNADGFASNVKHGLCWA